MPRPSFGFAILSVALAACSAPDDVAQSAEQATQGLACGAEALEPGEMRVFFAPFDPVEREALCMLDTARSELLVAHYNIRRDAFLEELVALAARGVHVQVAVDADNAAKDYNTGDDFLEENGIDIVRVSPPGATSIMHLKTAVIDGETVMTGSFNWNGTAALANDENMIVVRDAELAARYGRQVHEVRGDEPHHVEGGVVRDGLELHFAPEEKTDAVIVRELDAATTSVDVAMFTLTQTGVGAALERAVLRNVRVRIVMEEKQQALGTIDEKLEQRGALVVRGANKIGAFSAMHQKYAVIDGRRVITGATNWTNQGTRQNDEDLLIVTNAAVADAYRRSFADLLWVYAGTEDPDAPSAAEPGVLFNAIHDGTHWGDRVVVTGSDPALGSWSPQEGLDLDTEESMFPSWTTRAYVRAGSTVEYKYVTIDASGAVSWEPGPNRVLHVPASGRAAVVSGEYGDTSKSWTPSGAAP
jgi:phosphatidylserine/phosphatidylglycerophosphate/cardiolipin synthase-like enzyme